MERFGVNIVNQNNYVRNAVCVSVCHSRGHETSVYAVVGDGMITGLR